MTIKRLPSDQRRAQILDAARSVFAEKGFHGATTRALADAAEVSEALLFKHFPSKEAIYAAMLDDCQKTETGHELNQLLDLEPSTSTLIVMLHALMTKLIDTSEDIRRTHRLMLRSLSEDGTFTRVMFDHIGAEWNKKIRECLDAARLAGDIRSTADDLVSGCWLAQHMVSALAFFHAPDQDVIDYKVSKEKVAQDAVVFCLRGLGVTDEAIRKHYNPKAFALLRR